MAFVQSGNSRVAINSGHSRHRRAIELLALAGTSLTFLFVLAIAFGAISA